MSTEAKAAAPKRRRTPRRRTTKAKRSPLALVGQAGAVVGLISGVLGLLFIARPGCAPKPPPDTASGQISDVRVVSPIRFRRYLELQGLRKGSLSKEKLAEVGVVIQFHYELRGYGGKHLPLRWELDDAKTNDRVLPQSEALELEPRTNDEGGTWYVWVPAPRTRRTYYVAGAIYQPGSGLYPVADFRSPDFRA